MKGSVVGWYNGKGGRKWREGEGTRGVDLAVVAVLGAMMACSMVLGRADCVPGRTNPERGRPDWESGLGKRKQNKNKVRRQAEMR